MKTKRRNRADRVIRIVAGGVFALLLGFIFYLAPTHSAEKDSTPPVKIPYKQGKFSAELPIRLKIPKISVDAAIEPMGIAPSGEMEAPNGAHNVGWFKLGVRPGESGSAVLDGHSGRWANGEGSVFDDLNKLSKGDKIYVEGEKGTTTVFVVKELRTFDPKANATSVFDSKDGKSHLNIITCKGAWDQNLGNYPERLVVFADKE